MNLNRQRTSILANTQPCDIRPHSRSDVHPRFHLLRQDHVEIKSRFGIADEHRAQLLTILAPPAVNSGSCELRHYPKMNTNVHHQKQQPVDVYL